MKLDSLIQQLKVIALKSNMKIKLAAGVFYTKKGFIATGYNTTRTYCKNTVTASEHAECAVLRELKKIPIQTKCIKLLVIRLGFQSLLQSTPCMNCSNEIYKCGIKKVYYVNEGGEVVCQNVSYLLQNYRDFPYSYISMTQIWFQQLYYSNDFDIDIDIGNKIISLRKRLNLSQHELAIKLSLSTKCVADMEKGVCNLFLFSKLMRRYGRLI